MLLAKFAMKSKITLQIKMIMKKTYSENLARLFEIVDYLFLIPTLYFGILYVVPLFLYAGFFSFVSLFSQHYVFGIVFFAICFAVLGIYIFGVRLMFGYFKHSRGKLDKNKTDRLWISTIVFNGIFFFPSLYLNLQCQLSEKCFLDSFRDNYNELTILSECSTAFILLTFWWGMAVILPITALLSVERNDIV